MRGPAAVAVTAAGAFAEGLADVAAAARRHWLWRSLAYYDLRRRYARTFIGPLWSALSLALVVGALTFLFWRPLGGALHSYPVSVAAGLAVWQFFLATLGEAPIAFAAWAETIRTTPLPLSVFVLRLVWRNLMLLAIQAPVVVLVLLVSQVRPSAAVWTLVPALMLLGVAATGASLLLATIGARFRDAQPIVTNLLQLLFFLTPIFWVPEALPPERAWLIRLNPLTAFVDILRKPLLGGAADLRSWAVALGVSLVIVALGVFVFGRCRPRLAYWV